jgi:hypothetical protein
MVSVTTSSAVPSVVVALKVPMWLLGWESSATPVARSSTACRPSVGFSQSNVPSLCSVSVCSP